MRIEDAKQIDICDFLEHIGERCHKRKESDCWYYSPGSGEKTPSFHVHKYGKRWYDFREGKGGDIIDLAMHLFNLSSISEALQAIENEMGLSYKVPRKEKEISTASSKSNPTFVANDISNSLLMYSRSRGIHDAIMRRVCKQVHFQTPSGKKLYAIGFPNDTGGWELRNAFYKGCLGRKSITSYLDRADSPIVVCEGFFDYLSLLQLGWIDLASHNAVILNSTALVDTAIPFFFSRQIILCLDNDKAGKAASEKIRQHCTVIDDWSSRYVRYNDVNDYLLMK